MNKILTLLFMPALLLITMLTSCSASELNSKAEQTAQAFYSNLQKKDYTAAMALCSSKAFEVSTKEEWKQSLKANAGLLGDIKSFTKTSSFNIEASTTNGTTVKLVYDVQWEYGKSKDSVMLVKEKDGGMKLYKYTWKHSDTKYVDGLNESEKKAMQYIDVIKTGNYDSAITFCSKEALAVTPKEKWVAFLQRASDNLGTISSYQVVTDSATYTIAGTGQAGKGNYYDVFIRSNRNGNMQMEKIVFFQKDYNEPVRLTGHYFL
ncbi:MAG: hypothetical protein ABJB11_00910 [Ferruginibacter sp.]